MAENLLSRFKNVMLLSGTPDFKQIALTHKFPENECACSPKVAMDNGWICKPTLNLITCNEDTWPSAVRAVYEREVEIWKEEKKFKPVILVNCKSIDDIKRLREIQWFKDRAGKEFHFISIHSSKSIESEDDNTVENVTAEIDNISKTSSEAYEAIEKIDVEDDGKPVIVAQVQMIGEGINVKSFNACITASSSDKTAMQQIGRVIRNNFKEVEVEEDVIKEVKVERQKKGFINKILRRTEVVVEKHIAKQKVKKTLQKVKDGHANVYVIKDNLDDIAQLITNLDSRGLTDHCFSWGKRWDEKGGGTPEVLNEAEYCKATSNDWLDIDETDPDIKEIISRSHSECIKIACHNWLDGEDNDGNGIADSKELAELLDKPEYSTWKDVLLGKKMTDAEKFQSLMEKLEVALHDPWNKKIWQISHTACMACVFHDAIVSQFFESHLNPRHIALLDSI